MLASQTVADRILNFLKSGDGGGYAPVDIARNAGLNHNTVRRVTKELAHAGEIVEVERFRGAPCYKLAAAVAFAASTQVYTDPAQ